MTQYTKTARERLEAEIAEGAKLRLRNLEEAFKSNDTTFYIYAKTNDKAQLLVKKAQIDHCIDTAKMIEKAWKKEGYIVTTESES